MEPTTDRQHGPKSGRTFRSHANERLRILGEIPVRKFAATARPSEEKGRGGQPLDPDGNPDTSFLAKIPADVAFTFQTLDRNGMVLNMAQTWHQLRPGEIRNDCGGCHAHSQKPTLFKDTAAARPDYQVFDLTEKHAAADHQGERPVRQEVGQRRPDGLAFRRRASRTSSITATSSRSSTGAASPATRKKSAKPAGNLVLDDDKIVNLPDADDVPGTYYRLAMDYAGRFGHKPVIGSWRNHNASRYIRMFQSRRSLLDLEDLRPAHRRLDERRFPDRDRPRQRRRRCS